MKQRGYTVVELVIFLVFVVGAFGWVWNLIKIVAMNFDHITGLMVLRIAGVFVPPVGAIVGYF